MKKVLLVTGSLNTGGLEKVAMDFVIFSDRNEYKFDFLIYGNEKQDYQNEVERLGCDIIRINGPSSGYRKYYYELKRVFREKGPYDIVHSHIYYNSSIVMMAAKQCGVPLCISHSHSISRKNDRKLGKVFGYSMMRLIFRAFTDKYCACSLAAGEHVFGKREFRKKGMVIVNPIDVNGFKFNMETRTRIRKSLLIDDSQKVIGNVGRMVPEKNLLFLVEILKLYKNENTILLLVGDGCERKKIEKYSRNCNISSKIRFVGMKDNVVDYLSAMDIFVMPSKHEGLGIVLLEAMANGLICLYEDKAIVDEIKQLPYGHSIKGYNPLEWKREIDELLDKVRGEREQRNINLSQFNITVLSNMIDRLYDQSGSEK